MGLRGPVSPPAQAELMRIVESQIDKAASTKRGQLDPNESGILAIGAFHLRPAFIDDLEAAVATVLSKQRSRKPHLLSVVVGVIGYHGTTTVDENDRVTMKDFQPHVIFRVVKHPGYKGPLTLAGY
jgi:hypothetical protein